MSRAEKQDLLVIQGHTEVEGDLLRTLLEENGVTTFHVPSAASGLMGRVTGFRFAIRSGDRPAAEKALADMELQLDDFLAVTSAYNLDEPFHRAFEVNQSRSIRWGTMVLLGIGALLIIMTMIRACG